MAAAPIDWYRIPVDRETLRKFTEKSDLNGWLQAGSFLLVYLVLGGLALYFFLERWWVPMVIACYLHAMFVQMIGMSAAVHELSHGTPFKTRWINEIFYHLFCFLTWNNPVHFRASHTGHHLYTVYRGQDKEVMKTPVRELLNAGNLVSWLTFDYAWFWTLVKTTLAHAFGNGDADFFMWDPLFPKADPRRDAMIRWARIMLFGSIVLIAVFIFFKLWVLIFLVSLSGFFVTILGRLTLAVQHQGLAENTPDWRLVAHTVHFGPVSRWLYWNMNFHIEHHMYAAVPFHRLPAFHEAVKKDMPETPPSWAAGLRLVLSIRKQQEKDPGYTYVPKFPAGAAAPRFRQEAGPVTGRPGPSSPL